MKIREVATSGDAVARVLGVAANLIEKHGWTQGSYYRTPEGSPFGYPEEWKPGCSMCTLGALLLAGDGLEASDASAALSHYVGVSTVRWNDFQDRTSSEVVAAMRGAANQLEKGK